MYNSISRNFSRMAPQAVLVAFGLVLAGNIPVMAATNCNSGVVFSANTTLTADYEQTVATATPCITLTSGADLDFNGHTITCKGGYAGACGVAISATATLNSIVKNTSPTVIAINSAGSSAWAIGVKNAQEIDDLRIDQTLVGISSIYTAKVDGNVLTNVDHCIDVTLANNTAIVSNNFCSPTLRDLLSLSYGDRSGIVAAGTTSGLGAKVERNMVVKESLGIYGTDRLRINDNISCNEHGGSADFAISIDAAASQTGAHNLCCNAPVNDANDCTTPEATSGGFRLWP